MTHLIVAGNIGVGKSSFVERFAASRGAEPVYEPVDDNPFLADFYADMPRWALPTQLFFLTRRLRQHVAIAGRASAGLVVQDRSLYEDAEVFARNLAAAGHLAPREWATYRDLYDAVAAALPPPSAVVYLRASVPTLQRRIARRGRDYEKAIAPEYLAGLGKLYDEWVKGFGLARVVVVETDELDFVERSADYEAIEARVLAALPV
jgi:deoxyadenosine/deoxycytidine kinase